MGTPLDESTVMSALQNLPGWKRDGVAISQAFTFEDFAKAMEFVNKVAYAAEQANHHPDIVINYNRVTLSLVSHDTGGITQRDLRMAETISRLRA